MTKWKKFDNFSTRNNGKIHLSSNLKLTSRPGPSPWSSSPATPSPSTSARSAAQAWTRCPADTASTWCPSYKTLFYSLHLMLWQGWLILRRDGDRDKRSSLFCHFVGDKETTMLYDVVTRWHSIFPWPALLAGNISSSRTPSPIWKLLNHELVNPENSNWKGRLTTFDLLIKLPCFVKGI